MLATTKELEPPVQQPAPALLSEEYLAGLPRKEGVPDIVEMPYDETVAPVIITAVACGYLRAAFLLETEYQKSIREKFSQCVDEPNFWQIMGRLAYYLEDENTTTNGSVYPVDLNGAQAFKPQLPHTKSDLVEMLPAIITDTVKYQSILIKNSGLVFNKVATQIFPSRGKGGLFSGKMHHDRSCVSVHQTTWGERGMGFILDPFTRRTGVIATGTTTIFGPTFKHESSPVDQIAVSTYIDDMPHEVGLANNM